MKGFLIGLFVVLGIFVLSEVFTGFDLANLKFWGPKYAKAKREIYEQNPAYVEGHISDLRNEKFQYDTTKDVGKQAAILGYARGNLEKLDPEDVPSDLKDFYNKVEGY
jgi:hypothetical protein